MLSERERLEIVRKIPVDLRKPLLYILEEVAEELHEIKTDIALLTEQVVEAAIDDEYTQEQLALVTEVLVDEAIEARGKK